MKHIGIVGCSAEGAALCYRTIIEEGIKMFGSFRHPEISMHTFSLSDYMDNLSKDPVDWQTAGEVMLQSIDKLQGIGADFAICADNTIHEGFNLVRERSSLPYLHIAEYTASTAAENGMKKLLVLGTRYTMTASFYPEAISAQGLEYEVPEPDAQREVDRIIWDDLLFGEVKPESVKYYQQVIQHHKDLGCDGVVLGCTEIPLIINNENSPLPTLDSTRLIAHAALMEAIG